MRLQLDFNELTELLRSYTDAQEGRARAEGQLWKEQERNAQLEKEIRGLNARIDNIQRGMSQPAYLPGSEESMSQGRVNEMLIKVCGAMAGGAMAGGAMAGGVKINAIKLVREYTHLGLKEAKDIVEGTTARASGW